MSDILVQNNDPREYIGYYRVKTPGNGRVESTVVRKITIPANDIIRIPEEIWLVAIGVNGGRNTIAERLAQGRIVVVSGGTLSEENRAQLSVSEVQYQQFLSVYKGTRDLGGIANQKIAPHLSRDGVPSLEMVRLNLGNEVNGDEYNQFANRLRKELRAGMHSKNLVIPGAEEFEKALGRHAEPAPDQNSGDKAPTYDDMIEKLHAEIEYLRDENGFGKDGKPRVGALRERGFSINIEQRDILWAKYQEKYPIADDAAGK